MTPIEKHLADLIEQQGPISVATFMSVVLGDPEHGYYSAQRPFGTEGDFITAPEVSQTFGELVGLWCAQSWLDAGQPASFNFVELGPGRGILMADALRAIGQVVPAFLDAAEIHLVETSERLRDEQKSRLPSDVTWHERFDDLPGRPMLLIANEFFDVLPIRQYTKTTSGWRERCVSVERADGPPSFSFVSGIPIAEPTSSASAVARVGDVIENSPASAALVTEISQTIVRYGGAALVVDYGYASSGTGDTLQAVRDHKFHPVLSDIGTADVTAHVNFSDLGQAARLAGAQVWGPIAQGDFLKRLGIHERSEVLGRGKSEDLAKSIKADVDRLTAPEQMGTLFKVLAITDTTGWQPAGFEGTDKNGESSDGTGD